MMEQTEPNHTLFSNKQYSNELQVNKLQKSKKINKYYQSSDDQFQPQYHTLKKLKMPINKKHLSLGVWSLEENLIYLNFLKSKKICFSTQSSRREERIFCKLSQSLRKKRNPDQCRSHHKKLLDKHQNSIDGIIDQLQKKIRMNGVKEKYPIKIRLIGKYNYLKSHKQSEDFKSTSELKPPRNQCLWMQYSKEKNQIKEQVVSTFYKATTFKDSSRIIIEINQACIKSY